MIIEELVEDESSQASGPKEGFLYRLVPLELLFMAPDEGVIEA